MVFHLTLNVNINPSLVSPISLDEIQSNQSRSNPVQPVQLKSSPVRPAQIHGQFNQSRSKNAMKASLITNPRKDIRSSTPCFHFKNFSIIKPFPKHGNTLRAEVSLLH